MTVALAVDGVGRDVERAGESRVEPEAAPLRGELAVGVRGRRGEQRGRDEGEGEEHVRCLTHSLQTLHPPILHNPHQAFRMKLSLRAWYFLFLFQ